MHAALKADPGGEKWPWGNILRGVWFSGGENGGEVSGIPEPCVTISVLRI